MVNIVIYYPYLDGTSTSLIDMWFNLKRYDVDVDCYIVVDAKNIKQNIEYLKQVKNSTPSSFSYKTISLQELYERYWENLILSFGIFRFVDKLPLKYKHLFLLDAGRICFDVFANDRKLIKYVKSRGM